MRKFISYVNLYNQKEEKTKNVGFGRMTVEGEKCRLEIHVKNTGLQPQEIPVYFFTRRNDMLLGIKAGVLQMRKGAADFQTLVDLEKETNGALPMREMKGFIVLPSEGEYLASQWDEGRIRRAWFEEWSMQEKDAYENMKVVFDKNEKADGKVQYERERKEQGQGDRRKPEQEEKKPQGEGRREFERKENIQRREDENREGRTKEQPEKQEDILQQLLKNKEEREMQRRKEEAFEERQTKNIEKNSGTEQRKTEEINDIQAQSAQQAMRETLQRSIWKEREQYSNEVSQMRQEEDADEEMWKQLWKAYEVVHPFPQRPEIACVQIQLKDLRMLPQMYWYLGNNNFLLHGFCSYHHLLLGRSENGESFLGVPGIFQNQERVVAALFGFPHFFQKEPGSCKTGNFGYWARPIRLEERTDNEAPKSL